MSYKMSEYLFHYTSMDKAIKIIASNTLLFGKLETMNDINESYRCVFGNGETIKDAYVLLRRYQQLSFVVDKMPRRGYDIPSMWGHYAERGHGVCLVFDRQMLTDCFSSDMIKDNIDYSSKYDSSIIIEGDNVERFFTNNTKQLFFSKTSDWANEQEFRVIVKCANEMRTKINFRNSLQAAVLYFAEDVEKGDSVFKSSNMDILARLNPKIQLLELGYWNGVANLRNNNGEEIVL